MKTKLAAALRKVADKIDPPKKEKVKPGISLAPVCVESLDGFERPHDLVPKAWNGTPGYDGGTYL